MSKLRHVAIPEGTAVDRRRCGVFEWIIYIGTGPHDFVVRRLEPGFQSALIHQGSDYKDAKKALVTDYLARLPKE